MQRRLQVCRQLSGLVLYHDEHTLYYSRGYRLYRSTDGGRTAKRIARLPRSTFREKLAVTSFGQRFFRSYIRHAVPVGSAIVVLAGRRFFKVSAGATSEWTTEAGAFVAGSQPFHVAVTDQGIYYGEYRANHERSPVCVYRSRDGARSFRCHAELRNVRHIHGVFPDVWRPGGILVATGDEDAESGLIRLSEDKGEVETIAGGSQQFRAVTVISRGHYLYYGSDTPRERNRIYRLDRRDQSVTALADVGGSVFWARALPDGRIAFSTVVEPSTVNRSRYSELWVADTQDEFRLVGRYAADFLPSKLFQYSQIRFPAGPGEPGVLWITPFANWHHQRSIAIDLEAMDGV